MDEKDLLKAYNSIYLEIIMRYKDRIEEGEGLYIADLPRLVTPSDESVAMLAKEFEDGFPAYTYDENFADAAMLAYKYVKEKIVHISLPVQFWLAPAETIRYGAGDLFDKAVLLCSLLVALGNVSSRIIVVAREAERSFVVYSEYNGSVIAMDIEKGVRDYQSLSELTRDLRVDGEDATAYEFNDKMYRDLD